MNISKNLKILKKKKKIREYICDSGYRRRYGISKLAFSIDFDLKLQLNIDLKKSPNCLSWIIEYFEKKLRAKPLKVLQFSPTICTVSHFNSQMYTKNYIYFNLTVVLDDVRYT